MEAFEYEVARLFGIKVFVAAAYSKLPRESRGLPTWPGKHFLAHFHLRYRSLQRSPSSYFRLVASGDL